MKISDSSESESVPARVPCRVDGVKNLIHSVYYYTHSIPGLIHMYIIVFHNIITIRMLTFDKQSLTNSDILSYNMAIVFLFLQILIQPFFFIFFHFSIFLFIFIFYLSEFYKLSLIVSIMASIHPHIQPYIHSFQRGWHRDRDQHYGVLREQSVERDISYVIIIYCTQSKITVGVNSFHHK